MMDLTDISEEAWLSWKRKRRNTLIGYLIVGVMIGIDYGFMFATLYFYLRDLVKVERPTLFYGLIITAYSISSMVLGTFCGRWVDKTRKVKLFTTIIIIMQIIGCILYVFHFNIAFPFIGRLLAGLGDPFASVVSGEIIRIYDNKGSTRALWWLASVYSVADVVGPFIILCFTGVDFYIGNLHISQFNIIFILMGALLSATLVAVQFLIHDCSAEIDLKKYFKDEGNDNTPQGELIANENALEEIILSQSTGNERTASGTITEEGGVLPLPAEVPQKGIIISKNVIDKCKHLPPPLISTQVDVITSDNSTENSGVLRSPDKSSQQEIAIVYENPTEKNRVLKSTDNSTQEHLIMSEKVTKVLPTPGDCSQDDLVVSENTTRESSDLQSSGDSTTIPIKIILKQLSTNKDALLMFISTFAFMYVLFSSDVLIPLITSIILKWTLTALTVVLIGHGVLDLVLMMIMSKVCTSDKAVYNMSIICITAQIFMFITMISMKMLPRDLTRDIILIILWAICWIFAWDIEEVLIRCMLAKMVPSRIQSFTETLRNGVSRFSTILASITAPLIIPCLHYWSFGLLIVVCMLLFVFIIREKNLCNINELDFDD